MMLAKYYPMLRNDHFVIDNVDILIYTLYNSDHLLLVCLVFYFLLTIYDCPTNK